MKSELYHFRDLTKMVRKGNEKMKDCYDCKHYNMYTTDYPCRECKYKINSNGKIVGTDKYFEPKIPPQQKEITTPDRYAGGKYEYIDIMIDIFGVEATKHFCFLNAFKCLWKSEKETAKEDVENAVWYLNKYIELGDEDNDTTGSFGNDGIQP